MLHLLLVWGIVVSHRPLFLCLAAYIQSWFFIFGTAVPTCTCTSFTLHVHIYSPYACGHACTCPHNKFLIVQVKDIQLNCMVNRELTRRVKFGPEVAWASRAVHSDLLLIQNLVKSMDSKVSFWEPAMLSEQDKAKVSVVTV